MAGVLARQVTSLLHTHTRDCLHKARSPPIDHAKPPPTSDLVSPKFGCVSFLVGHGPRQSDWWRRGHPTFPRPFSFSPSVCYISLETFLLLLLRQRHFLSLKVGQDVTKQPTEKKGNRNLFEGGFFNLKKKLTCNCSYSVVAVMIFWVEGDHQERVGMVKVRHCVAARPPTSRHSTTTTAFEIHQIFFESARHCD